ncbi:MAG: UPF0262 family protein [Candidatus Eiseniibacteriota bacterium]
MAADAPNATERIANIVLDERTVVRRSPDVEHERAVAIFDLLEENRFAVKTPPAPKDAQGPYNLYLSIQDNRLILDIRDSTDGELCRVPLSLMPFRRIVKDYFTVCESYFAAIKSAPPSQIEAIDMGRRGLHNEGSELLRDLLAEQIDVDFDTARRLFTLICVLHIKG